MIGELQKAEWLSGFPEVKQILLPVDFSTGGVGAVRAAVSLAAHFQAVVTFFHVLEPVIDDPEISLHWADFPRERREYAQRQMEKLAEQMGMSASKKVVVEGRAFEEILRYLSEGGHQMVVMGQAKRAVGFIKGLLGTTVERVARHSPVPILVVRDDHEMVTLPPQRLALATDGSQASLAAFPWAEWMARRCGTRIELVNVQEPMGLPGTVEYERHQEQIDELRKEAEDRLRDCRESYLAAGVAGRDDRGSAARVALSSFDHPTAI